MLAEGGPHQEYCTLCGVPFNIYGSVYHNGLNQDDLLWVGFFFALRTPKGTTTGIATGSDGEWFISGISQQDRQQPRVPPPGYDIRDILKGREPAPAKKLRYAMNEDERKEWKNFESLYKPRYASEDDKLVYPMHPSCWDILVQQHALIAPPTKKCLDLNELGRVFAQIPLGRFEDVFRPDWATDYAGPEQFWWEEDISARYFDQTPEWRFLAQDPGAACGFDELLANPPLESATNTSPRIQSADDRSDIFSCLPEEILTEILVLLPSASVRDLQLSSRRMASVHLSSEYWRSRFEFPNELCHVKLPPALLGSGRVGERWVDWRRLCDQLLHPVGDNFGWWQNRKRIAMLNKKLVESMPLRRSDGSLK